MQWILENWMLLFVGGGMVAMHLFRHGHKDRSHTSQPDSAKRAGTPQCKSMDRSEGGTDG